MRNLISSIAIVALTALASAIPAWAPQEPSDSDWSWLGQNTDKAFEVLMPMDAPEALISYRSYRDQYVDTAERYFSVRFSPRTGFNRDDLQATVVFPVGGSIQRQLLNLRMKDRAASFESVLSQVAVKRTSILAHSCRAVKDRMDALSRVRLQVPDRDVIHLHPFVHRLVIDAGGGRIDATLYDERDSLVRWAIQTNEALVACARAESGNGRYSMPKSR